MSVINIRPMGIGGQGRIFGPDRSGGNGSTRKKGLAGSVTSEAFAAGLLRYVLEKFRKANVQFRPIPQPPPFFSIAVSASINSHEYALYLGNKIAQFEAFDSFYPDDIVLIARIIDVIGKFAPNSDKTLLCISPNWPQILSALGLDA